MSGHEGIVKADGLNSFMQTDESEIEDDIEAFTNAIEEKLLEEEDKREGDMKRKSTSLDQEEENQRLQAKKVKLVWGSPITRLQDLQSGSDVLTLLEELKRTEKAVCLGFELDKTTMKCRLCGFIPTVKSNLTSHINKVHCINFKLKLCKSGREEYFRLNSNLSDRYRGCRKIFTEESFDIHTCTLDTPNPEQILEQSFELEEKMVQENLSKLEMKVKAEPSPPQPPAPSPALPADDNFRASTTLTLFIEPDHFHRSKMFESTKNTGLSGSSLQSITEFLLGVSCQVYPPQEEVALASCHVAIQPPNRLSESPAFMNSYTRQTSTRVVRSNKRGRGLREATVKTLFYTNKAGLTMQCQNQSKAFLEISTFLGKLRKAHPSKQMNIFVKDFEVFKNLLHIPDFRAIVLKCEQVCTLFNQDTSSLARVPAMLPLPELPAYVNSVLGSCQSYIFHREPISNVFSGSKY